MAAKLSDIGKIITNALKSKTVLEVGGEIATESIKKRTRLGSGVKENLGPSHKLPKLKSKTVTNRKLLKEKGMLTGPNATPGKSGLNASGELLNNVEYNVGKGQLQIRLADPVQREKATNLIKIDPNFVFMNLSKPEFNRMLKAMSQKISEILSKIKFDKL